MTNLQTNQAYYDSFPEEISIREDRIKLWWKDALDFVFKSLPLKDKTILEIGAGKGILADYLSETPRKLVYTDVSQKRLDMNKYRQLLTDRSLGILSDLNSPCFDANQFDLILFVNCLMFAGDKVELMELYKPLLKPGGMIVIVEPLSGNPFYILRRLFSAEYKRVKIRNTSYRELETICARASTVKKRYFFLISILSVPFFLEFPDNCLVTRIQRLAIRVDSALLRIPILRRWATLGCAIIGRADR